MVNDKSGNTANQGKKAQAMVEFAIAIPIIMVLVLAIFEFGRLIFVYTSISAASREAARYGAGVGDTNPGTNLYNDCAGIKAAAVRIGRFAGVKESNISIYHYYPNPAYNPSAYPPPVPPIPEFLKDQYCIGMTEDNVAFNQDDRIEVKVDVKFDPIVPLVNISSFFLHSQNAHTILTGADVAAVPQPTNLAGGQICDVTPYKIYVTNPLGPIVNVYLLNTSGATVVVGNILIVWDTTSGPVLQTISGIVSENPNSSGPSYSSSTVNWNFGAATSTPTPPPTPTPAPTLTPPPTSSLTITFSKKLANPVIIRLELEVPVVNSGTPGTKICAFGQ